MKFGMGMSRFGMEHCARRTADWLLVAVRALVLVSKFAQLLSKCPNHTKLSPVSRAL